MNIYVRVGLLHMAIRQNPRRATTQAIHQHTRKNHITTTTSRMSSSAEVESQPALDVGASDLQSGKSFVEQSRLAESLDSAKHRDQHHQDGSKAATKVFGIPELLEQILLEVDDQHALRTTLTQVSKTFQQTILGSIKLQRTLHAAPDWTRPKLCPAPIPSRILAFPAHKDKTFDHATAPTIKAHNRLHNFNLSFDRDALAWASDPASTTNGPFRNMLISQPPPVFFEIYCWSNTADYRASNVQTRIMNADGITCGQMFDLVRAADPIGGNVRATLWFGSKSV